MSSLKALKQENNPDWQRLLSDTVTDPNELLALLNLDPNQPNAVVFNKLPFSLRAPRGFVARMKKGDWHDPLLRQVLPIHDEAVITPGFTHDPLDEEHSNPIPGLLHKYHGRALLTVVGACAIHCRYCFRRYFPYQKNNPGTAGWKQAIQYISDDPSIREVIFSGGDPLVAHDDYLEELAKKIAAIPHVKTLRIHTRLPIVIPERITDDFLNWMKNTRLRTVLVLHCNHAQEVDASVFDAIQKLRSINVTLLNQSVLLKGVNNTVEDLANLSEILFDAGVLPYYLHLLDKVQGAAHFEVSEETAKNLIAEMRSQMPGYLVPKLVREEPGALAKVPL